MTKIGSKTIDGETKVNPSEVQEVDIESTNVVPGNTANDIPQYGSSSSLKGNKGDPGEDGLGISDISKTSTDGLVDTYTITYTDDSTSTFEVTNGDDGTEIELQYNSTSGYIEWKLTTAATWNNVIAVSELKGETGDTGDPPDLQVSETMLQYSKDSGSTWIDLYDLSNLSGDDGEDGNSFISVDTESTINDTLFNSITSRTAADGDAVLNTNSGNNILYIRDGESWINKGTINGTDGTNGSDGSDGIDGDQLYSGSNGPETDVGITSQSYDEYYFHTTNKTFHKKPSDSESWSQLFTLSGDRYKTEITKSIDLSLLSMGDLISISVSGMSYSEGQMLIIANSNLAYFIGEVNGYSSDTLQLTVTSVSGTTASTDWTINIASGGTLDVITSRGNSTDNSIEIGDRLDIGNSSESSDKLITLNHSYDKNTFTYDGKYLTYDGFFKVEHNAQITGELEIGKLNINSIYEFPDTDGNNKQLLTTDGNGLLDWLYTILDEDDLSSNSPQALATQQSIKNYVDSSVTSGVFLDYVIEMQSDSTTDPGASPSNGDRYILLDTSDLNTNFGTITGVEDNDIVEYNGSGFIIAYNASEASGGVTVTVGTDKNGDSDHQWYYNTDDSSWKNRGATSDHGNMTGLGDDDHSQYLLLTGRDGQTIQDTLTIQGLITKLGDGTASDVQLIFNDGTNRIIKWDDSESQFDISEPLKVNGDIISTGDLYSGSNKVLTEASDTDSLSEGSINKYWDYNADNNKIVNVANPTSPSDAANKSYVDDISGGDGISWQILTTNSTIGKNGGYLIDTTSALTLTLPDSPSEGDKIIVVDYKNNASSNNITIDRNDNNIEGNTSNFVIDVDGEALSFIYTDATQGWKVMNSFGQKTTDDLSEGSTNLYDKTVDLTGGTDINISGTYPSFTIAFANDSGYIIDYTVTETDVTQHEEAITITESQISDLNHFSGAYSDLTGKPTSLTDIDSNIFGDVSWSTTALDWSDERVRNKTISSNEIWTFSNLKAGKTISVYVTGDYSITLPDSVTTISGTYDGTTNNLIIFHCINDTNGSEIVVCQIFNL